MEGVRLLWWMRKGLDLRTRGCAGRRRAAWPAAVAAIAANRRGGGLDLLVAVLLLLVCSAKGKERGSCCCWWGWRLGAARERAGALGLVLLAWRLAQGGRGRATEGRVDLCLLDGARPWSWELGLLVCWCARGLYSHGEKAGCAW